MLWVLTVKKDKNQTEEGSEKSRKDDMKQFLC